ncbi:hypothetical protein FE391_27495 [Nonomuraea sp. KC401]|uniref:hypothetical protein n=1 Tax=unclassified Nonomuraea TaxID=2593643 RepID=UPI0010FDCDE4|nr:MULTISPECIES: hypothetical protein [unclassified Nonomuraea]NBE97539.1 hypothetical protein [Nonomuraea sp. K271]TLF64143.1 hypothetical protein FE391_27495 [Nonomuraea sp. KC401]
MRTKLAAVVSAGVLAAGIISTSAAPASAASAASPCGSGYKLVGAYNINKGGQKYGLLEIRWNARTGKNCALAYGSGSNYGRSDYKSVRIRSSDKNSWADTDWGDFSRYAGPVYVAAKNKCIDVAAHIEGTSGKKGYVYKRDVHCG